MQIFILAVKQADSQAIVHSDIVSAYLNLHLFEYLPVGLKSKCRKSVESTSSTVIVLLIIDKFLASENQGN